MEALARSGKPLIVSNGTGIFGDTGETIAAEFSPVRPSPRVNVESIVLSSESRGIRAGSVGLPLIVYGHGGSVFVPTMIEAARRHGISYCIGEGQNRISTVHVDDAARLYVLALEHENATGVFHAADAAVITLRATCDAIGRMLNVPTQSASLEVIREIWHPTWAGLLALTNRVQGLRSFEMLHWTPIESVSLLKDIEFGSYAMSK